jgi:tetratricopeptide (TPR) repeat protein
MILGEKTNQPVERQKSVNELLDQLEIDVSKLGQGYGIKAEDILLGLDAIRTRLDDLEILGRAAKAEEAQFEFITNTLKTNSNAFIREIGGINALIDLRSIKKPDRKAWWWFLDEIRSRERAGYLKKQAIWIAVILVVLVVLYVGYQRFLAPSPAIQAAMAAESNIENSLISGDLNGALNQADQGLAAAPGDVTLLILKGITQLKLGHTSDGTQTLAQAEKLVGNQESYLLQRALLFIRSGDYESALSDTQEIITNNPQSAEGYFYEGLAYQNLGQVSNAYNTFDKAQTLANAQGKTALVATIRLDMALLLQNMGSQLVTPTP